MAINHNDEKIGKFYQAILHYGEAQRKKIEEEVAAFKQKELDEAEVEVLTEAYHLIQKEMAQMRSGISREMAPVSYTHLCMGCPISTPARTCSRP